ncbi:MAG: hypothetical protein M9921_12850 [Fimbriimonadaceae bacterium]|nr:hypothetical protein [Fimbriimonadaceae bacterium]
MTLALLLCAGIIAQKPFPQLERFVNRDLTTLAAHDKTDLANITKSLHPVQEERWSWPEPRWIRAYPTGAMGWLYLRIYPGYNVPDVSYVEADGFDSKWNHLVRYEFPTGYRLRFEEEKLLDDKWIAQPVLSILVSSVGPFITESGKPQRPLFHPESGIRQFYAFDERRAYLIRVETGGGETIANSYRWSVPMIGPSSVGRTVADWTADLRAADPVRQLACMVWLAGGHLSAAAARHENISEEPAEDSKTYEVMRADPAIRARVESLKESPNPWVRKQAEFTLKNWPVRPQ